MNKLQAAARDKAAKLWKMRKIGYRIGSIFKKCNSCESLDVWRSYRPSDVGWTYWCYFCGAKDYDAWASAGDVGENAQTGVRTKIATKNEVLSEIEAKIAELQAKLALMEKGEL